MQDCIRSDIIPGIGFSCFKHMYVTIKLTILIIDNTMMIGGIPLYDINRWAVYSNVMIMWAVLHQHHDMMGGIIDIS